MKKSISSFFVSAALLLMPAVASGQTLNVRTGNVTWKFRAADVGDMTYADAATLAVMGKTFKISDISDITVDDSEVTDNSVAIAYSGTAALVTVAGNVAQYVSPTVSGGHVSIAQSDDLGDSPGEITYTLSGSTSDGEFYLSGSYKATLQLNGVTITNATPVYSGAAIHVQNGKRINIRLTEGTTSTLTDAASGSQKGSLYVKGHAEIKQKGTLNVYGNASHAIKTGEYLTMKNATVNVKSAVGDGINCNEYFLMESGTLTISGTGDDGLQCSIDGDASTGQTSDHDGEDSGNIYIEGGTININATAAAAKGIKSEGDMLISGGDITVTNSAKGAYDTDEGATKGASCLNSDGSMTISGGTLSLTATGSGGKGIKVDSLLTISGGEITVKTSGGLYYNNGSTNGEQTNYTGNTDRISNDYYSSPKGIKAGKKTSSGSSRWSSSYTYSGGISITGGKTTVTTTGNNAEGIESKNWLTISGGETTVTAYDDAINSAQDMTITGGYVYARGTNNDGLDANGNCYIQGGLVYAIGTSSPEVAIDANSEDQKQLYVSGGTIVAIGGLESGASLTQACYSSQSWSRSTWYALTVGDSTFVFQTPASAGSSLVVSGASTPTLKSGVSYSGGTTIFSGSGIVNPTVSGGSSVSLSSYSGGGGNNPGGGGGGGGGRPGGGGGRGGR